MSEEAMNDLQKEWRAIVLDKLSTLEKGQKEIKDDIVDIKTTFVRQQALEELRLAKNREIAVLREKIEDLNAFKYKLIGIAIGANIIISALGFMLFHK
jgi:hypothetical protein